MGSGVAAAMPQVQTHRTSTARITCTRSRSSPETTICTMQEVEWKPEAPVTFWFTRHGVSEYNLEDRIGGDSNITPAGQVFADTLPSLFGRVLQESGDDHRFISVWTSTLIRTIQTASKLPLPQVCASQQLPKHFCTFPFPRLFCSCFLLCPSFRVRVMYRLLIS